MRKKARKNRTSVLEMPPTEKDPTQKMKPCIDDILLNMQESDRIEKTETPQAPSPNSRFCTESLHFATIPLNMLKLDVVFWIRIQKHTVGLSLFDSNSNNLHLDVVFFEFEYKTPTVGFRCLLFESKQPTVGFSFFEFDSKRPTVGFCCLFELESKRAKSNCRFLNYFKGI